jgi:hypothetical protein
MDLKSVVKAAATGIAVGAAANLLGKSLGGVSGALGSLGALSGFASSLRSSNIPLNADNFAPKEVTTAQSGPGDDPADWRVRLSFPGVMPFVNSPLFTPLINAGGMVFPYTPTISINSTANYTETPVTHNNFAFISYANSKVSEISVSGDFYVEDAVQAQYWLSCVHFLRSVTKMFTGDSPIAGNPPVILYFNAYGDYVFRDVPVVVRSFSMTLPKEVDYITTNMTNPPATAEGGFGQDNTSSISGTAQKLANVTSAAGLTQAANALKTISNVGKMFNGGSQSSPQNNGPISSRSGNDDSHVPTQSTLNISLLPIYSRNRVRKFNLETFLNGGYVKDGYI